MPKKKETTNNYKVSLQIANKEYTAEHENLEEAFKLISPDMIKVRGFMRISKGEQEFKRIMQISAIKQTFINPLSRRIRASLFSKLFK